MKFCPYCGGGLKEDMLFCPKCGKPVEDISIYPNNLSNSMTENSSVFEENALATDSKAKWSKKVPIKNILLLSVILVFVCFFLGRFLFTSKHFSDDSSRIAQASDSVVMLYCYNKDGSLSATGSGFAAFSDDIIVTNYHVIASDVYSITAKNERGDSFECPTVIAFDEKKDIALLKGSSSSSGLSLLPIGHSATLQKGDKVVAIGSPLGLMNSVSSGVFSGFVYDEDCSMLQFTAAISHGSSGGALFNDRGEVVGITSASYTEGQSLNLAIPIEEAARMWESHEEKDEMSVIAFYEKQRETSGIRLTFDVVHGDGSMKTFPIQTTAHNLREALEETGLIDGEENEYGLFVETVDGETAEGQLTQWWCFYKNGEMLMTGVDETPIANGEHYAAVLTVGW